MVKHEVGGLALGEVRTTAHYKVEMDRWIAGKGPLSLGCWVAIRAEGSSLSL